MIPEGCEECKGCKHLNKDGSCKTAKHCPFYLEWFSREWEKVREAARKLREEMEESQQ